jgi:hypothetical protein
VMQPTASQSNGRYLARSHRRRRGNTCDLAANALPVRVIGMTTAQLTLKVHEPS